MSPLLITVRSPVLSNSRNWTETIASSAVSRKHKQAPDDARLPMTVLSSQLPERSSVNSNAVGEPAQRSCLDVVAARAADRSAILSPWTSDACSWCL